MSPSIPDLWQRIEAVLERISPRTARTLAPGATEEELRSLEEALGLTLPSDLRQSLQIHNGQADPTMCCSFTNEGLLLSVRQIAEKWRALTDLDENFRKTQPGWDENPHGAWWSSDWIPFTENEGSSLCVDLRQNGTTGSILCHIHDNPHEPGIAASYGAWLTSVTRRLEAGEYEVDEDGYLWLDDEPEE